jgi:hypothetical protein
MMRDDSLVAVRGRWDEWRTAQVSMSQLHDLFWMQPSGTARPILHAYVSCDDVVTGEIPHRCGDGTARHRLLVCVLRKDVTPSMHATLERLATSASPPSPAARL